MSKLRFFLLFFVTIIFLIVFLHKKYKRSPTKAPPLKNYSSYLKRQKTLWASAIKRDPKKAYEDFKKKTNELSFNNRHGLAHEFGVLLFTLLKEDGVGVCDDSFSFGCTHGFFGEAVRVKGFDYVYVLDQKCARVFDQMQDKIECQHGLGHAILAYYEESRYINDVLAVCSKLKQYSSLGGCLNGAFMEYNYSNLRNPPGKPRPLTNDNKDYPCNIVPQQYKESCYFFQSHWWQQANGASNSDYKFVGKQCSELSQENFRKACFTGAGQLSGFIAEYDLDKAVKNCLQMPITEGQVYCRSGLRFFLFSDPKHRDIADKACGGLPTREKNICIYGGSL